MYDPHTVAFDIHYPWPFRGEKSKFWPKGRPITFITIWHHDPEVSGRGNRTDDSCGWFTPPSTKEERDRFEKVGESTWRDVFRRRAEEKAGDPDGYAYVCFEPTYYEAIYWCWRRIKREYSNHTWMYGRGRGTNLTPSELEYIQGLASNPNDNLRVTIDGVVDEHSATQFFMCVWNAYRRHHRPWYRHPRWHIGHWHFQIHPWQQLRRRLFDRCAECGKPFKNESPVSHQWDRNPTKMFRSAEGLYHSECSNSVINRQRATAEIIVNERNQSGHRSETEGQTRH